MQRELFAKLIRDAIEELGLQGVGDKFEVSHTTIQRWAKGECRPAPIMEHYVVREIVNYDPLFKVISDLPLEQRQSLIQQYEAELESVTSERQAEVLRSILPKLKITTP